MSRKRITSGNDFWANVEEAMTKNQPPVKEWISLYEVNWNNRVEVRT